MSDSKQPAVPHTALHDFIGLGLIALGALLGTSAIMYLRGPNENPGWYPALMSWFVVGLGAPAILWMCLGFLFVGGRLYLFGAERGLRRDAGGFLATSFGLSILLGALSTAAPLATLGGAFGFLTGAQMSRALHPVAGVILGLASIVIPAGLIWLRAAPPALVAKANALIGEGPVAETPSSSALRRPARSAPQARAPTEDPSGVTSAEADALLPNAERDEILLALRTANRNSATFANHAPSPYPADVRREGGIPAGARPIETANEPRTVTPNAGRGATSAAPPPSAASGAAASGGAGAARPGTVHTWSAPKPVPAPVHPGADLAGAKDARGAGGAALAPKSAELKPLPVKLPEKSVRAAPPPPQGRSAAEGVRAIPIHPTAGIVGAPTWETAAEPEIDLDEAEAEAEAEVEVVVEPGDAEVVDAYGTPLELVAELRGKATKPAEIEALDADADLEDPRVDDDEDVGVIEPWVAEDELDLEEEEEQENEADAEVELHEDGEVDEVEALIEEEEALDEDEEDVVEPALAQAPKSIPAEDVATAGKGEREVVLQPVQNNLFDAPAQEPQVAEAPRERTVVMEPRAAPDAQAEAKPTGDDLVYKSGMLFLQHKRVAVSMLQREFGLDFKQATAVLDQLQQQGLIGPYLGGQRRDILLTAQEWRAKVGAAS